MRAHLDGCASCRQELDELAPASAGASSLGSPRGDRRPAGAAAPSSATASSPASSASAASGRAAAARGSCALGRRRALAGAALAAVVIALWPGDETQRAARASRPPARSSTFRDLPPHLHARATLTPRAWGTAIAIDVEGARPACAARSG